MSNVFRVEFCVAHILLSYIKTFTNKRYNIPSSVIILFRYMSFRLSFYSPHCAFIIQSFFLISTFVYIICNECIKRYQQTISFNFFSKYIKYSNFFLHIIVCLEQLPLKLKSFLQNLHCLL